MKLIPRSPFPLAAALLLGALAPAQADLFVFTPNLAVPDGLASGVTDTQNVTTAFNFLTDVNVSLTLSPTANGGGGYNGDLYVSLVHESGFSVLLNRVGRRTGSSFGYGDVGFNLTLDDSAPADVHSYRLILNGDHTTPLTNPLDGSWQPDGRTADPSFVTDLSPRSAGLSSFNGVNPNGAWSLFVADVQTGGLLTLDSWSLNLLGTTVVPEVSTTAPLLLVGALLFRVWQRRQK